jgi:anti-sigma regulatory factor (Ser/Thr protein kinase)
MTSDVAMIRTFRAHPSALAGVRAFIREVAAASSVPDEAADDLVLAVSEACGNAVLHSQSASIFVSFRVLDDAIEVHVKDEGVFRRRLRLESIDGTAGHGTRLMLAAVDELTVRAGTENRPGTLVRLVKRTERAAV